MSRWRRQQRKRTRRLREARATEARLEEAFAAVRAAIRQQLSKQTEPPFTGYLAPRINVESLTKAVLDAITQLVPLPESKTTVKATPRNGNRTLDVDITVSDPSPELAAQLLEMGGHWVEPTLAPTLGSQTFDFGFTFEGKLTE